MQEGQRRVCERSDRLGEVSGQRRAFAINSLVETVLAAPRGEHLVPPAGVRAEEDPVVDMVQIACQVNQFAELGMVHSRVEAEAERRRRPRRPHTRYMHMAPLRQAGEWCANPEKSS